MESDFYPELATELVENRKTGRLYVDNIFFIYVIINIIYCFLFIHNSTRIVCSCKKKMQLVISNLSINS